MLWTFPSSEEYEESKEIRKLLRDTEVPFHFMEPVMHSNWRAYWYHRFNETQKAKSLRKLQNKHISSADVRMSKEERQLPDSHETRTTTTIKDERF